MAEFIEVKNADIKELAALASDIWHEYWPALLSSQQIDYMVDKFQSENAIIRQYQNENYTYYFITESGLNIGYFGISEQQDYLFLSKLYLSKEYRAKGIGTKTFNKVKELAASKNYKEIRLTVNKYNQNSIKAYLKWGFEVIDSVVTDIGSGFVMDDYIMSWKL